jgi:hypothetical protein
MTANSAYFIALLLSVLSFGPYYYVLNSNRMAITESHHVRVFFLLWLAYFTFEFYILGPYSFIEMSHEGNLNPPVDYYLAHHFDGGKFSHQFGGGQDLFIFLPGMQYLNIDALLQSIFPFWVVILLHKIYFSTLGFFGAYLIARHHAPDHRTIAVAIAAIFPVTHEYLLNFSTNWGTGFAAVPLAVYACTIATHKKNLLPIAAFTGVILSAADPVHVFPALAVAVIGYVIFNPQIFIKKALLVFSLYIFLSLIVWHEFIYANATLLSETARLIKGGADATDFFEALFKGLSVLYSWMTLPFGLFLVGLILLGASRSHLLPRGAFVFLWIILSYIIAKILPWERFGLDPISKLSHNYMLLSITVLFIPVLTEAVKKFNETSNGLQISHKRVRLDGCILALALSVLTFNKAQNFAMFGWFGGQSSIFGFEKLSDSSWKPKEPFRAVTLFERPPANNIAGMYNIDSFDGQPSLYLDRWAKYWDHVQKVPNSVQRTRVGLNWARWNGQTYDIDSQVRLDLLGVANVRFLLSALPLKSGNLKLVFAPTKSDITLARPVTFASKTEFIDFRLRRIFDPGELYIYELENFLPRVFSASSIDYVSNSITQAGLHKRVSLMAPSRKAVILHRFKKSLPTVKAVEITTWKKVVDGFDIKIKAPEGGVIIINNSYLPFWKAWGDGKLLKIVPANGIHMAVGIPPDTANIQVRYKRLLLREKIMGAL